MQGNFLSIDFETANTSSDSACSIGVVRVENQKVVHQAVHLIRPPSQNFMFTHIHGLTWQDVASAPSFREVWSEISGLFEGIDFVSAHNASFDSRVLKACMARYGIAFPKVPFVCTVELARQKWNLRPTRLPDVCRFLNLELNHHEALSDALACANIVLAAQRAESHLSVSGAAN
jgi:DNA polymerase-3 subunit epsilon